MYLYSSYLCLTIHLSRCLGLYIYCLTIVCAAVKWFTLSWINFRLTEHSTWLIFVFLCDLPILICRSWISGQTSIRLCKYYCPAYGPNYSNLLNFQRHSCCSGSQPYSSCFCISVGFSKGSYYCLVAMSSALAKAWIFPILWVLHYVTTRVRISCKCCSNCPIESRFYTLIFKCRWSFYFTLF